MHHVNKKLEVRKHPILVEMCWSKFGRIAIRNQPSLVDIFKTARNDPHLVDFHTFEYIYREQKY